jgi:hypothetical protein
VFPVRYELGLYILLIRNSVFKESRVEAESNTSNVALRVVRGDKKGSLESETVNYGRKSHGTRT